MEYNPLLGLHGSHEFIAFEHRMPIALLLKRFLQDYKSPGNDGMSPGRCADAISRATGRSISKTFVRDMLVGKGADAGHFAAVRNFLLALYPDVDPATVGGSVTLQLAQSLQNLISKFRRADHSTMSAGQHRLDFIGVDIPASLRFTTEPDKRTIGQGNAHPVIPVTATFATHSYDQPSEDRHYEGLADFYFRGHLVAYQNRLTGPLCDYQRKLSVLLTMSSGPRSDACMHLTVLAAAGIRPFHHASFSAQVS